ncbi:MAG: zf-TFIIB domain-containing protein [Hyphomicrobiaceae bacterium]|nr:zf-TFIIB domain-containing protein [Hyphomicrobiaceae bacterium]
MSVLMCPVCQGAMREVAHQGVTIDTCTKCRGVWLDRGELEKIAAAIPYPELRNPQHGGYEAVGSRRRDDDDDDDRRFGHATPQKRGMGRFLDFFD